MKSKSLRRYRSAYEAVHRGWQLQFIGNCSVAYVILTHQSDPPLLIFCHGMLQSEGACIVHLLQNPQDKNRCFGNRDNKKMRLCPKVNPHDSIRVLMCGLRTGIPSGLAPGAQSFRTGSPSSGGFHPFRLGWIGGESFPPTSIWFWKADPVVKTKNKPAVRLVRTRLRACSVCVYPSIKICFFSGTFGASFFGIIRLSTPFSNLAFMSSSVMLSPT